MPLTPEQRAREDIDRALEESGWTLQNRDELYTAADDTRPASFRARIATAGS
jgi:hypothetical protein